MSGRPTQRGVGLGQTRRTPKPGARDAQGNVVTDLSPLEGCTTLEEIVLPSKTGDLSVLRQLPRLKLISMSNAGGHTTQTAGEFWKEYDAQQAGSLRHPGEPTAPLPPSSSGEQ